MKREKGITLIGLIVTIIILLILAGISIASLGGENGLFSKVKQAKKAQIESEMKEQLILALSELQLEKKGEATLDDVTQKWADSKLKDYEPTITNDASTSGKKVTMSRKGIVGKYLIDEKLGITVIENSNSDIEFSYDVGERNDNKVNIVIHVRDRENGLTKIEFTDAEVVSANGTKEELSINYSVEIGTQYKIKITSENGQVAEEIILISDYWYNITKNLGEEISIDNVAIKAAYNKSYQATLTTEDDYVLDTVSVTMAGEEVAVDKTTGVINIENVTGNIEITATAKKLEMQITTPIIGTSTSSTESVEDNSQTKDTTLYINFKATLEGTNCTITLKDDTSKTVPYAITSNGKYTFIVSGTYNGKTVTKEIEVVANKYETVGGFVQYDAGDWTQEEIAELQLQKLYDINTSKTENTTHKLDSDSGLALTFGGFTYKEDTTNQSAIDDGTVITSRNQSVKPSDGYEHGTPSYDGWQILESEIKDGRVYVTKIVHAGSPENFVHVYDSYNGCRAEYLLSGGIRQTGYKTLSSGTTINPRDWDVYKDKTLEAKGYISDVHMMRYDEAYALTTSQRKTDGVYFLATCREPISTYHRVLWYVKSNGSFDSGNSYNCIGIRPVVTMNDGVYIVSGDGTEESPYVLGM